jgi:xanthine dehydrogenase accessory factor
MKIWSTISDALDRHGKCAMVTQLTVEGSAPREAGARMIVMPDGTFTGTIGGGALEWRALAMAQTALRRPQDSAEVTRHALGPELGQCCGGATRLLVETFSLERTEELADFLASEAEGPFEVESHVGTGGVERTVTGNKTSPAETVVWHGNDRFTETFGEYTRKVFLFGAGHVGKAIVLALAPLPFDVTWIDSRRDAFPGAVPANVKMVCASEPAAQLADAPDGSFVVVLTHSHALDQQIVHAALGEGRFDYVGVIGSRTKRARFVSRMSKAGLAPEALSGLVCPIGMGGITSKKPPVIAASLAAQLLEVDELVKNSRNPVQLSAHRDKLSAGG